MGRVLRGDERTALEAMIASGEDTSDEQGASAERRREWMRQVPRTFAGRACGCGTCPSIHLVDEGDAEPEFVDRVVLEAWSDDALLLLFVDDGRLSYLELAPLGDTSFAEFPPPAAFGL